jgi:HTH-type transcriptional regulator/antitoxin HigA
MVRSRSIIAIPPGATIKEQLEDRNMTQKEFAARMDMSEKHISRLINGEVKLSTQTAVRLEMVLGIPAQFWNRLEAIYREKLEKARAENDLEAEEAIAKKFPYSEMVKLGWVPVAKKAKDKVISLRKYFEVVQLGLLKDALLPQIACRRLSVTEKGDMAVIAWAQQAKLKARECRTDEIDIPNLKSSIPLIRSMTLQSPDEFYPKLIGLLAQNGVALVMLPQLKGSYLHGATFNDSEKIVLGLTVRGKDADKFWFSLFHELGHIILYHVGKKGGTDKEDESAADAFARDSLIPPDLYTDYISRQDFSRISICRFAARVGVDQGIVVGRLQSDGLIEYSWYNDLKTGYILSSH